MKILHETLNKLDFIQAHAYHQSVNENSLTLLMFISGMMMRFPWFFSLPIVPPSTVMMKSDP